MGIDHWGERKPPKEATTVNNRAWKKRSHAVRASELAQMGVCERLVVFDHRFGKRSTEHQRKAITRGLKTHDQFYGEGVLISGATAASEKRGAAISRCASSGWAVRLQHSECFVTGYCGLTQRGAG